MEDKTQLCPTCETPLDDLGLCPRCLLANAMEPTAAGQSASPAATLDEVAASFPDLEVIELIGKGGMGAVYKCRQKSLDRFVALKILPQTLAADESFALRFQAEAKALAALNHPNIVTIHDFGHQGDFYFLLMEFVDGLNLRHLIRDRKLSPEEALAIVPPLCEALQFAHERKIIHRDIKPENLLLDTSGRIKIADFGIATIIGQTDPSGEKVTGTPAYMAPEQRTNATPVDARADIYSLGVVLYEMLTGERPDAALTPPSQKATLDVRIDEVVLRALSNQPDQRWQSATEFNTRLQTVVAPISLAEKNTPHPDLFPHSTPRRARISAVLAVSSLFLIVLYLLFHRVGEATPKHEEMRIISEIESLDAQVQFAEQLKSAAIEGNSESSPDLDREIEEREREIGYYKDEIAELEKLRSVDETLWQTIEPVVTPLFFLIILIAIIVGIRLGLRHLSWLCGQSPRKPALSYAFVGTFCWLLIIGSYGIVLLCICLLAEKPFGLWTQWHFVGAVLGILSDIAMIAWLSSAVTAWIYNEEKPLSRNRWLYFTPLIALTVLFVFSQIERISKKNASLALPLPKERPISKIESKTQVLESELDVLYSIWIGNNLYELDPQDLQFLSISTQLSSIDRRYPHLNSEEITTAKTNVLTRLTSEQRLTIEALLSAGHSLESPEVLASRKRRMDLQRLLGENTFPGKSTPNE